MYVRYTKALERVGKDLGWQLQYRLAQNMKKNPWESVSILHAAETLAAIYDEPVDEIRGELYFIVIDIAGDRAVRRFYDESGMEILHGIPWTVFEIFGLIPTPSRPHTTEGQMTLVKAGLDPITHQPLRIGE